MFFLIAHIFMGASTLNRRIRTFFKSKDISYFIEDHQNIYEKISDVSYSSLFALEFEVSIAGCFYTDFNRLDRNFDPFLVDYQTNFPVRMCEECE